MSQGAGEVSAIDQRRFVRVPLTGRIGYRYGPSDTGRAECINVSPLGMQLRLGRYLRPGRRVLVTAGQGSGGDGDGPGIEFKAQVAWCRPSKGSHVFDAGLRVFHDEPDSVTAIYSLLIKGLKQLRLRMAAEESVPATSVKRTDGGAVPIPLARLTGVVSMVSTDCTVITAGLCLH